MKEIAWSNFNNDAVYCPCRCLSAKTDSTTQILLKMATLREEIPFLSRTFFTMPQLHLMRGSKKGSNEGLALG